MLNFFVTLLLISTGIMASDVCNKPPNCNHPEAPLEFPETNEELQKVCNVMLEVMECTLKHTEICLSHYPGFVEEEVRVLTIFREICSEDSLLHAAIVDNLKCFKNLVEHDTRRCMINGESKELLEKFANVLSEEGLISLTDNENDTVRLYDCIDLMNYFACNALTIERRCGNVAMNVYTEILQKPGGYGGCQDAHFDDIFPVIIRLRRVEEEKEKDIADMFRKKK